MSIIIVGYVVLSKVVGSSSTQSERLTGGPVVSADTTFVPKEGDISSLQSGRETHQVDLKLDQLAKLTHDLQLAKYQGLDTKGIEDQLKLGLKELKDSGVDTAKIEEGLGAYGEELRKEIEIADKLKAISEEKLSRVEIDKRLDEIPGINKTEALKMLAKLELEAEANRSKGSLRIVANKRDGADALKLDLSLSLDQAVPNESPQDKVHRLNLQRTKDERVDALLSKYPEFLSREKVEETIRGTEQKGLVDLYLSKTKNMPWTERRTELLNAGVFTESTEAKYRETLFRQEAKEVLALLDARYEKGLFLTPAEKGDHDSQVKVKAVSDRITRLEAQLDRMITDVPERLIPILGEELKFLRLKAGEAQVQGLAAYQGFKEGEEAKALAAYEKAAIEGGALFATTQILTNARDAFPKLLESSALLVGGNLAQLGGFAKGVVTLENPLTSARDWGSGYVEGSREFFNKNAWGGSTFGGDEAFSSKSLYSMGLKDMNPVAHFGDAVVSPAFSLIDVGRVEISRRQIVGKVLFGNIQVVADVYYGTDSDPVADLTYSQYRELEQSDSLLKGAKYSFQVAEISASLAMGRPESVGGMTKMLSGSLGMGVVGSAGRELMREDGKFDLGTFLENTLSQTADSSVFMAGMSGFSSLFVRSRIGDIGSKLVRGEALTHAELKLLNSTQKQAVLMRELVDNVDGLGDLSGSVENFGQVKTTRQSIGAILNFLTAASDVGDVNLGLGDRVGNGVDAYLNNRKKEEGKEISIPVLEEGAVERLRSDLTGLEELSLTEVDGRTKEEILRTPAVALRSQDSKYDKPVSEILNYKNSRDEVRAEYILARTNELVKEGVGKEQAEAKATSESRRVVAFYNQETKSIVVERPRTLKEGESPSQKERLLDAFLVKHELDHYKQDPNLSMIEGETQSLLKRAGELNKLGFDLVLTESGSWIVVELASKDKPILARDPGYFQRAVEERTHSGVTSTTLNLMSEGERVLGDVPSAVKKNESASDKPMWDVMKEHLADGSLIDGPLPEIYIENERIIAPDSKEGRVFQSQMERITRRLFPDYLFEANPIRFFITDKGDHNAYICKGYKPIIITFDKSTLQDFKSEDELAYVLGHELTHLKLHEELGGGRNSKGEEYIADNRPLLWMHEAGYDAKEALNYVQRAAIRDTRKVDWFRVADVHGLENNRADVVSNSLAALDKHMGGLHNQKQDIVVELKDSVASAHHESYFDKIKLKTNYDSLDSLEQLQILTSELPNQRKYHEARLRELQRAFSRLVLDPANEEVEKALNNTINKAVDNPVAFNSLLETLAKKRFGDSAVIKPIGKLAKIARSANSLIEAETPDEANKVAEQLLRELEAISSDDLELSKIQWPSFALPKRKELREGFAEGDLFIPPWDDLVRWAGKGSSITRALLRMGVTDPRVFELLSIEELQKYVGRKIVPFTRVVIPNERYDGVLFNLGGEIYDFSEQSLEVDGYKNALTVLEKKEDEEKRTPEGYSSGRKELSLKGITPEEFYQNYEKYFDENRQFLSHAQFDDAFVHAFSPEYRSFLRNAVVLIDLFNRMLKEDKQEYRDLVRSFFIGREDKRHFSALIPPLSHLNAMSTFVVKDPFNLFSIEEKGKVLEYTNLIREGVADKDTLVQYRLMLRYKEPKTAKELSDVLDLYDRFLSSTAMETHQELPALSEINNFFKNSKFKAGQSNITLLLIRHGKAIVSASDGNQDTHQKVSRYISKEKMPRATKDCIAIYETLNNGQLFPSEAWRQKFAQDLLSSIKKIKKPESRIVLLEKILFGNSSRDIDLKIGALTLWIRDNKSLFGVDAGTQEYHARNDKNFTALVERVSKNTNYNQRYEIFSKLADALETQREWSFQMKDKLINKSRAGLEETHNSMVAIEYILFQLSREESLRKETIEFLMSPFTKASQEQFIEALPRGILSYRSVEAALARSVGDEFSRTEEAEKSAALIETKRLYENYWNAPMPVRVLLMDKLLFTSEERRQDMESNETVSNYEKAFNYVIDLVLPTDMAYASQARKFLSAYSKVIPSYQKTLLLSSMMVAGERCNQSDKKNFGVGKRLAMILELMGPAERKLGQTVHSHPQTPDDIRVDMERLKSMAAPPARWDLISRFDVVVPKEYQEEISRIGSLKGSASYFMSVGLEHKDGTRSVMAIQRENATAQAKEGFRLLHGLVEELRKTDEDLSAIADTITEMIEQAEGMSEIETDSDIGAKQVALAQGLYNGLEITVGGETFYLSTAPWVAYGAEFRDQKEMPGQHFNDLAETTPEEKAHKKAVAKAYLATEFLNILKGGAFDHDRHGAQLRVSGNNIGLFDHGAMEIEAPSEQDKIQLAESLFQGLMEFQKGVPLAKVMYDQIEQIKAKTGNSPEYLVRVERGLLALSDFFRYIEPQDISEILVAIYNTGQIDKTITDTLMGMVMSGKIDYSFLISLSNTSSSLTIEQKEVDTPQVPRRLYKEEKQPIKSDSEVVLPRTEANTSENSGSRRASQRLAVSSFKNREIGQVEEGDMFARMTSSKNEDKESKESKKEGASNEKVADTDAANQKSALKDEFEEVKESLRQGKLPESLIEDLSLFGIEDPATKGLQIELEKIFKALYPNSKVTPVFLLSKESGVNAFCLRYTNPPMIGFNYGCFKGADKLSSNAIAGIMAHEFAHYRISQEYGTEANTKLEEGLADWYALDDLYLAGIDPKIYGETLKKLSHSDSLIHRLGHAVLDPHPDIRSRIAIWDTWFTDKYTNRGEVFEDVIKRVSLPEMDSSFIPAINRVRGKEVPRFNGAIIEDLAEDYFKGTLGEKEIPEYPFDDAHFFVRVLEVLSEYDEVSYTEVVSALELGRTGLYSVGFELVSRKLTEIASKEDRTRRLNLLCKIGEIIKQDEYFPEIEAFEKDPSLENAKKLRERIEVHSLTALYGKYNIANLHAGKDLPSLIREAVGENGADLAFCLKVYGLLYYNLDIHKQERPFEFAGKIGTEFDPSPMREFKVRDLVNEIFKEDKAFLKSFYLEQLKYAEQDEDFKGLDVDLMNEYSLLSRKHGISDLIFEDLYESNPSLFVKLNFPLFGTHDESVELNIDGVDIDIERGRGSIVLSLNDFDFENLSLNFIEFIENRVEISEDEKGRCYEVLKILMHDDGTTSFAKNNDLSIWDENPLLPFIIDNTEGRGGLDIFSAKQSLELLVGSGIFEMQSGYGNDYTSIGCEEVIELLKPLVEELVGDYEADVEGLIRLKQSQVDEGTVKNAVETLIEFEIRKLLANSQLNKLSAITALKIFNLTPDTFHGLILKHNLTLSDIVDPDYAYTPAKLSKLCENFEIKEVFNLVNLESKILLIKKDVTWPDRFEREEMFLSIIEELNLITDVQVKQVLLEKVLCSPDIEIRRIYSANQLIEQWTSSIVEEYGKDDGSAAYYGLLTDKIEAVQKSLPRKIRKLFYDSLAKKIVSQEALTSFMSEKSRGLTEQSFIGTLKEQVGADLINVLASEDIHKRINLLNFLVSPRTDISVEKMFDIVSGMVRAQDKSRYRTNIIQDLKLLHTVFSDLPMEARAVAAAQLLLPAHSVQTLNRTWEEAKTFCFNTLLANGLKLDKDSRLFLSAYLDAVPSNIPGARRNALGAILSAAENISVSSSEELDKADAICSIIELMGPAEVKAGQAASGHPQTSSEYRHRLARLKNHAAEPSREELFKWIRQELPQELRDQIVSYGDVLGSGSLVVTMEVQLVSGKAVIQLLRPYAFERASAGFSRMEGALKNSTLSKDQKEYMGELIRQGKLDIYAETDFSLSVAQQAIFYKLYDGVNVSVKGSKGVSTYAFHTPSLLFSGERCRLMKLVEGEHFVDMKEGPRKAEIAKAILAVELSNILSGGHFDKDAHGGNIKINGNSIYRFDFGAVSLVKPSEADLGVLAEIIATSIDVSKQANDPNFVESFFDTVRQKKLEVGELPALIGEVQRALLALSEYYACLSPEDLKDVLRAVYEYAHKDIKDVMREKASDDGGKRSNQLFTAFKYLTQTLPIKIKRKK